MQHFPYANVTMMYLYAISYGIVSDVTPTFTPPSCGEFYPRSDIKSHKPACPF